MRIFKTLPREEMDLFRNVHRQWRQQLEIGFFYAEGQQVFAALLQAGIEILTILITPAIFEQYRLLIGEREFSAFIADKSSIEEATGRKLNQGVIAFAKIPEPPPLNDRITQEHCCVVALNGIDHAVNVGSILRNCAAFGVSAVIFDAQTIHPYCWRTVQASIGGVFQVPVYPVPDLTDVLKAIRQRVVLVSADPAGNVPLSDWHVPGRVCLIFGNEHRGISKNIRNLNPARVGIPLQKIDSLNVAAASALFLYEAALRSGR